MTYDILTPDGRSLAYVADVQMNGLTPHYVYTATRGEAEAIARGSVSGVWEYIPTIDGAKLAAIDPDRYSRPYGTVRVHPLLSGVSGHRRIVASQECLIDGCEYTVTVAAVHTPNCDAPAGGAVTTCSGVAVAVWHGLDTPARACERHAAESPQAVFDGHHNRK